MVTTTNDDWGTIEYEFKRTEPALFVLFGCTGDLAARKIYPALANLALDKRLHERTGIVGIGRRDWDDGRLREFVREGIQKHSRQSMSEQQLEAFLKTVRYQKVQVDDDEDYRSLADRLDELDEQFEAQGRRLFYVAMGPEFFGRVAAGLDSADLTRRDDGQKVRIVLEKPFGHDLESAQQLNRDLRNHFDETQLYRIDHYLGKETVMNMLVFRFANALFEPHLHASHVHNVQITTAEAVGMEGRRGPYYESVGALRDMIQNHMMQLTALLGMERPECLRCEAVRDRRSELLKAVQPLSEAEVAARTVRGQYLQGEGPAYRDEKGVADDSTVETYAAVRLAIDNERWRTVPFYLRTGKRLAGKLTTIVVTFRHQPHELFMVDGCDLRGPNRLIIRIAPDEGIALRFDAKVPDSRFRLRPVEMDFRYDSAFESATPEAYEHLIADALVGDGTLFIRGDETEACWRVIDSIRAGWAAGVDGGLHFYEPGTWGPVEANRLFDDPYMRWFETS